MGHEQRKTPWTQNAYDWDARPRKATKVPADERGNQVPTDWLYSENKIARVKIRKVTLKDVYSYSAIYEPVREVMVRENGFCCIAHFRRISTSRGTYYRTN